MRAPLGPIALCVIGLLAPASASTQPLAAPFDVEARRAVWGAAVRPFRCGDAPAPLRNLEADGYYADGSFSVVDPARYERLREAVRPIASLVQGVSAMTGDWVRSLPADGERARCAIGWLDGWARSGALLGEVTLQGGYERKWALAAVALSWLSLRGAPDLDRAAAGRIVAWIGALAAAVRPPYEDERRNDARNNHAYWAALATAAAAVATDDRALFDWALARARRGLAEIGEDGTLPLEMARRSKALHYHLFSAAPLVLVAEIAAANGIDVYRERNGALHRLVRRTLDGLADPSFFATRTGAPQDFVGGEIGRWHVAWVEPYFARFPAERRQGLLDRFRPMTNSWLGGDTTLFYGAR